MQFKISTFREYFKAVCRHWYGLVAGLFAGLFGLLQMGYPNMSIPLWILWSIIFVGVSVSQFLAWNDARKETDEAEKKLTSMLDEYICALHLESIGHLNLHKPDAKGNIRDKKGNLTERTQREITLNLRNSISRPIFFKVIGFEIDGISQLSGLLNTGSNISPNTSIVFRSNKISAPPIPNAMETVIVSIKILYGHPDGKPSRKMTKKARVEIDPNNSMVNSTWIFDGKEDEPV